MKKPPGVSFALEALVDELEGLLQHKLKTYFGIYAAGKKVVECFAEELGSRHRILKSDKRIDIHDYIQKLPLEKCVRNAGEAVLTACDDYLRTGFCVPALIDDVYSMLKNLHFFAVSLHKKLQSSLFVYGQHPFASSGVSYAYATMFKYCDPATHTWNYKWNYYAFDATPSHPYDKDALIAAANGTTYYVARDANGHLLLDFNHDGEIDVQSGGSAFHEHNGNGSQGAQKGTPFTCFWFDDNWLARYMSRACGREEPYGLSDYSDFTRWRILEGSNEWKPYEEMYIDTLCLDCLYYITTSQAKLAFDSFFGVVLPKSGASYGNDNQQYTYDKVEDTYHLGLMAIVAAGLMNLTDDSRSADALQHFISLRSNIISVQQVDQKTQTRIGWLSSLTDPNALINIETIAVSALALGANCIEAFEYGYDPLSYDTNAWFFRRPYNVLSAVVGLTKPQMYMSLGPQRSYGGGSYYAEFFLRVPADTHADADVGTIDVYYESSPFNQVVAQKQLRGSDMAGGDRWTRFLLPFSVDVVTSRGEFNYRTLWSGKVNLDCATIRVTNA